MGGKREESSSIYPFYSDDNQELKLLVLDEFKKDFGGKNCKGKKENSI